MAKIYKQPFAHSGDAIAIPSASQPDGKLSSADGWTPDYQLLKTDPNYKPVGRQEMNGVFKEVTEALGQVQVQGAASWSADGVPYPVNAQVYYNGKQWLALRPNSVEPAEGEDWESAGLSSFPGEVRTFAGAVANVPDGWLPCNGAAISRTTYSRLLAVIGTTYGDGDGSTTFNIPDLRGEFIRGLDNGRGVDVGRALGSAQLDALQDVIGSIERVASAPLGMFASGVFSSESTGQAVRYGTADPSVNSNIIRFNLSAMARTSTETRSRNVAMNYIIKY